MIKMSCSAFLEMRVRELYLPLKWTEISYNIDNTIEISTQAWQPARKGITPIELATLKEKKKEKIKLVYISTTWLNEQNDWRRYYVYFYI